MIPYELVRKLIAGAFYLLIILFMACVIPDLLENHGDIYESENNPDKERD